MSLYNVLGWLETNKKRLAIWAGVAALAGVIIGVYAWQNSEHALEAEEALSAVRIPSGAETTSGAAAALAKVAADFPKTQAAAKALLRAGSLYYAEGNYPKARAQFEAFAATFDKSPWAPQAALGLAACLDAENKTAEAITKYKDFIAGNPADPSIDSARLTLARLYERSEQPQPAFELLSKLATPGPQGFTAVSAEAQQRVRDLMLKYPSLMASNAPTATRPPTTITPAGGVPNIQVNPATPTPGTPNIQITPTPAPASPAPTPSAPGPAK